MTERRADRRAEGAAGTIVTFYSYKGGTGRTMALANTAWILAAAGHRVLAVDWDLDAPGLHRYLHPFLLDSELRETDGIVDMVRGYALALQAQDAEPDYEAGRFTDLSRCVVGLDWEFGESDGRLDFLASGRQGPGYARRAGTFDWNAFSGSPEGQSFLTRLRDEMRADYDYILIDSRTGIGDTAGICTVTMPDVVVAGFALSEQAIDGSYETAKSIAEQRRRSRDPVLVLPVPMRVDGAERDKVEAGRDYVRARFREFVASRHGVDPQQYWGAVEIPYRPFYSFEEVLAVFGDRPQQPDSLLAAYERLTGEITGGRVTGLEPMPAPVRRAGLSRFERVRNAPQRVRIVYSPRDRLWADWVRAQLVDARVRVVRGSGLHAPADTGEATAHVLLLSPDLPQSAYGELALRAVERARLDRTHPLIAVRVEEGVLPDPYTRLRQVSIAGLVEETAKSVLQLSFEQFAPDETLDPVVGQAAPRFPGSEPAVRRLPARNARFTGRDALLEQLRDQLGQGMTAVLPQAIYGLGGVGKTQVALEYAHRFGADYDIVWWAPADEPAMLRRSLADLAERLGVGNEQSVAESARAALEALRTGSPHPRWLLVLDNANEPDSVSELLPQGGGPGHVLVTSRDQSWSDLAVPVELDVFPTRESVALLRRSLPSITDEDAERVATMLGNLPLAVEQAAAWLATTGMSVAEYLEAVETRLPALITQGYPPSVQASWELSMERLRDREPAAARMLELCSFLSPEAIGLPLLTSPRMLETLSPLAPNLRDERVWNLFRVLGRYGLGRVDYGAQTLGVHRLVQAMLRGSMTPEEQKRTQETVLKTLAAFAPGDVDAPGNRPAYEELQGHLRPSGALHSSDGDVRRWVVEQLRYMWKANYWTDALPLGNETHELWKERYGPDDPFVLRLAAQLGNVLRSLGDVRGAYLLDRDTLRRQQDSEDLGPDHPHTLMTACSVGGSLRSLGRFREALEMDQDTYDRFCQLYGEEHAETLKAANNLAVSTLLVGDPFAAMALDEETYARRARMLRENDAYTWLSANNLGVCQREAGLYLQSETHLRDAANHLERLEGGQSPAALRANRNLAATLRRLGRYTLAHSIDTAVRNTLRQRFGENHPDALACAVNLAADCAALGKSATAVELAGDAMRRFTETLGDEHPFTYVAELNLSVFLRQDGRWEEAYPLAEQCHDGLRRALGRLHPFVLASLVNLANVQHRAGEPEAAHDVDAEAYRGYVGVLGGDHPHTLVAGANLALSTAGRDERTIADRLFEQVEQACRRKLGPEHPTAQAIRSRRQRLDVDAEIPPT
ncbi:FxSxx-COOH system tetratricopeptide repeat protein [Yinghuangia seranimata]|uniref:FxSxx-COOH system tetratricopeptide repeat protein n=1 Tax=Yinghuangia seranimata TaxID=408067 RepID=UPI00248C7708|nr:FxSxx-COOH system tetratricopeptide repeat protein [Yinghuangia seranimata]MDI2125323.1 FxSxx-COOH system tetratricopeptide repeat protein [Yinghuangia seranimata]